MNDYIIMLSARMGLLLVIFQTCCYVNVRASIMGEERGLLSGSSDDIVDVSYYGAKGDGVTDDSESINRAISAAKGKILDFGDNKVYLIKTKLSFYKWTGEVRGNSWIKCIRHKSYPQVIDLSFANNVVWNNVSLDMGQKVDTEEGDPRSDNGFYFFNSRNVTLNDVEVKNVRIGEPIYINGTSSKKITTKDGSKYIYINRFRCIAFPYDKVDKGTMFIVRSDFYTGSGDGGELYAASNGVNKYSYAIDRSRMYPQTTEFIYINDCYMANFDRLGLLNVSNVVGRNNSLINFYTRGITLSPTCSNIRFSGGSVGANAAMINVSLCCSDIAFDGIQLLGSKVIVGQRHGIRVGQGSKNVAFKNINGLGCETALVAVEGVQDVSFENVHLKSWAGDGLSTNGIIIGANNGVDSGVKFHMRNISFTNCSFQSKYGIYYRKFGSESVDFNQIKFQNVRFNVSLNTYNTHSRNGRVPSNVKTNGIIYIKER